MKTKLLTFAVATIACLYTWYRVIHFAITLITRN